MFSQRNNPYCEWLQIVLEYTILLHKIKIMRKILGLDLGTTSIGWAIINEAEHENERSSIIKAGVRVNPLTVDEQRDFQQGNAITTTASRTLQRSARRNLQRYKLRRENLLDILKANAIISENSILAEHGKNTTFQLWELRAKAAVEQITLDDFARVLLTINKKRGYKSSRKAKNEEEGTAFDGMKIAKALYDENLTPGQYALKFLNNGGKVSPEFYASDLRNEFERIWESQQQFHAELTSDLAVKLRGLNATRTKEVLKSGNWPIYEPKNKGRFEKATEFLELRVKALQQKIELDELSEVLIELNKGIGNTSGYLGDISDRSKELYFKKQTVGQFLWSKLQVDRHFRTRGEIFYRQDYLDEFETIWETQAKFQTALTPALKEEIRDVVIFYQRKLKSQKGLISFCEFEAKLLEVKTTSGKKKVTAGPRVIPRSSPIFQEFKLFQQINGIRIKPKGTRSELSLTEEDRMSLFEELNWTKGMTSEAVLKKFGYKKEDAFLNFKSLDGNRTNATLIEAYEKIMEKTGHDIDLGKLSTSKKIEAIAAVFEGLGINPDILKHNSSLPKEAYEQQASVQLWHLLYSFEGDDSKTGDEKLLITLQEKFGFPADLTGIVANVAFLDDYGSLSTKAIRKLLPHLVDGKLYNEACEAVGYNHSHSETAEVRDSRPLKDQIELLRKNSLRNPVVEKILNQMIHVVNAIITTYGKPDEVRIEMARELKNNAEQRKEMFDGMNKSQRAHEEIRKRLQSEYGLSYVSRNDIIRYKLYEELRSRGFKTLYSNKYIPAEKLFSKEIDIEHIIPQSRQFDDSFSNKTLEYRADNIEKGNQVAYDYIALKRDAQGLKLYEAEVYDLFKAGGINYAKMNKLLRKGDALKDGFLNRELGDTQYISRKAREILHETIRITSTTTGSVTSRLRKDWQLENVLQELNWDKYEKLGLTFYEINNEGKRLPRIKDWTKRNDHRHHAMDAITVAFTKPSHVQYLNNLNARLQGDRETNSIRGIEQKELYQTADSKLRFKPPVPIDEFRSEVKVVLESILVSHKAKNKVVTRNINKIKTAHGSKQQLALTPRGQLHNETIYGSAKQYVTKEVKVSGNMDEATILRITKKRYREVLLARLQAFENDPKKAFTGKNSLDKNPIWLNEAHSVSLPEKVTLVSLETVYTIRKPVTPDLNVEKVIDAQAKRVLEKRLAEFGGDPKKAFVNLEQNPIYLDEKKTTKLKSVKITGIANASALRPSHDHLGNAIVNEQGHPIQSNFINTGNNHHIAIYEDEAGNWHEEVVSHFEAVTRVNEGLPIIQLHSHNGYPLVFTLKQNDYFIFNNSDDIMQAIAEGCKDHGILSRHLFRVQKISSKYYVFNHHLQTVAVDGEMLKNQKPLHGITHRLTQSTNQLKDLIKVRVNHLGEIIEIKSK
jgi:CRISPR-associated endonuclease Csn1